MRERRAPTVKGLVRFTSALLVGCYLVSRTRKVGKTNPSGNDDNIRSELVKVNLAEFDSVKKEIQSRSGHQATLVTAMITAIGVIAAVYFTKIPEERIFFVMPIISFILGMGWLDHDVTIRNLGEFVKVDVKKKLAEELGVNANRIADFEPNADKDEGRFGLKFSTFSLPTIALFVFIPAGSLYLPFYMAKHNFKQIDNSFWMLLYVGCLFLSVFTLYYLYVVVQSYRLKNKKPALN